MYAIENSPIFAVFTTILVVETLKTLLLGTATAFNRGKLQKFMNQEDADWLGGIAIEVDDPIPGRLMRAHRNNLENLLPFFIGGLLYVIASANSVAGTVYMVAFLVGRTTHTYAYLSKRAMLRRNAYTLAWLAIIAMTLHAGLVIVRAAL